MGGGLGRTYDGTTWQTIGPLEAAAWARLGDVTAVLSTSPNWVGSDLRFLDTQATARFRGRFESGRSWDCGSGFELGGNPATAWGGGTAAFWLNTHLAVVVRGGSYPEDFAQGFPGGAYLSLRPFESLT